MYSQYYQEITTPNETVGAQILSQIDHEERRRRQIESDEIFELFVGDGGSRRGEYNFNKMHDALQRSNRIEDVDRSSFMHLDRHRDHHRQPQHKYHIRSKKESIAYANGNNVYIVSDVGGWTSSSSPYYILEEDKDDDITKKWKKIFDKEDAIMTFYYGSLSFFALYITFGLLSRANGRR